MKFSIARFLVVALTAETAVASSWFAKAPYNKWHETELERWLADHDIPFPTAADRKDLQNIVKDNWQAAIESPYVHWDTNRLQSYLKEQGKEVQKSAESNKNALVDQVKSVWHDTDVEAHSTYDDVKTWIFNTWSNSQLKAFLDRHGIPSPQPYTTDSARSVARENYQSIAQKLGATASYPGNWLYESWTDSDLKAWLDKHGVTVPSSTNREKLIASVRRNSYLSRNKLADYASSASSAASTAATDLSSGASSVATNLGSSASSVGTNLGSSASSAASGASSSISSAAPGYLSSGSSLASRAGASVTSAAAGAYQSLSDALFDTWSDSQLKEFADKNGIKVPQGSKRNEVLAVVRKYAAKLTGDNVSASASSAYGAATSKAGNEISSASAGLAYTASSYANHYYTEALIALGVRTNYASSVSGSASSAYAKATSAVKGEL